MERSELQSLAREWMGFWQRQGFDDFERVHAADFVDHSAAGRAADRDGLKAGIADLYRAFPDFDAVVDFMVVDEAEGLVTIRWTAAGHHRAPFLGIEPQGRRVDFTGIEVIRCRDGAVIERWGEWDQGAILEQMTERG